MKRADTIAGFVLLVFFGAVLFESLKLPLIYLTAIGPGFLPVGVSLILVILSALLFVSGLRRPAAEDQAVEWPGGNSRFRIVVVIGTLVAYTILMPLLGYGLSSFLFLFVLIWLLGSYRWYWSAGVSLAIAVFSFLAFQVWLGLALPRGLLSIP